jgi:SNF2 family DNA or RNA helicase
MAGSRYASCSLEVGILYANSTQCSLYPCPVLCPSSARYHWESEFLRWLGDENEAGGESTEEKASTNSPQSGSLSSWQINVLTNSKSDLFPYQDTKIVVCTYGLALSLVQAKKMVPGMFGCAIVDESHMLKNKSSKRSKALVPLLRATPRCVLLSGTPALARPAELWPQLDVLGVAGRNGFWEDETDFMNKYVRRGGMTEKAELHTMLTGTIMIRRLKHEILKDLPRKVRSQALVHILTADQCTEFKGLLAKLRKSKGTLGEFARSHHASLGENAEESVLETQSHARADAEAALRAEMSRRLQDGRQRILSSIGNVDLSPEARNSLLHRLEGELRFELDKMYAERSASLDAQLGKLSGRQQDQGADDTNRTTLLSHMYGLTGDCKIPLIVDMLQRWLADPTKGKLCIFAHHLSVLNAIRDKAGLSNDRHSLRKFIRIDGATMPKQRQELIKKFQADPSVRIALLGITAAGVAVTLTASSTVWFAELFWTPALMIQAEDRYVVVTDIILRTFARTLLLEL